MNEAQGDSLWLMIFIGCCVIVFALGALKGGQK
jgi:hypothetical protein